MTDISKTFGGPTPDNLVSWNPTADVDMRACTPVTISPDQINGQVMPAEADDVVVGLCARPANVGLPVTVKFSGPLERPVEEWKAINGGDPLIPGAPYYVRGFGDFRITTTRPVVNINQIGIAINENTMFISITGPENLA